MAKQLTLLAFLFICIVPLSCQHQPYVAPAAARTGDPSICFATDVLPIFISECAKSGCHDAGSHELGYILDSYENIVKKGIIPGNAAASKIYQSIWGYGAEAMPLNAPALSSSKMALIKRWIEAGAIEDSNCNAPCDSDNFRYSTGIQPLMDRYCVGCHSGSAPQGSLDLTGYDHVKTATFTRNLVKCIKYEPGYKSMPQGGLHLSNCEIRQVEKWVSANMPND